MRLPAGRVFDLDEADAALALEQSEWVDRLAVQAVNSAAIFHLVHVRKVAAEVEAAGRRRCGRTGPGSGCGCAFLYTGRKVAPVKSYCTDFNVCCDSLNSCYNGQSDCPPGYICSATSGSADSHAATFPSTHGPTYTHQRPTRGSRGKGPRPVEGHPARNANRSTRRLT